MKKKKNGMKNEHSNRIESKLKSANEQPTAKNSDPHSAQKSCQQKAHCLPKNQ